MTNDREKAGIVCSILLYDFFLGRMVTQTLVRRYRSIRYATLTHKLKWWAPRDTALKIPLPFPIAVENPTEIYLLRNR